MSRRIIRSRGFDCIACAYAMAMDVELKVITDFLRHDGSGYLAQGVRRGICEEELARFALTRGWSATVINRLYAIQTSKETFLARGSEIFFDDFFTWNPFNHKLVVKWSIANGPGHAVFVHNGVVLDPVGKEYRAIDLNSESFDSITVLAPVVT